MYRTALLALLGAALIACGQRDKPEPVEVIARKTVVTTSEAGEKELQEKLALIAKSFRNGIIEERQAIRLVTNLK